MEDSFIAANFQALCRLCLNKTTLMMSIFEAAPDGDEVTINSKIATCSEVQITHNDGLPDKICYKCIYKLDKCIEFKRQCKESENKLREIVNHSSTIKKTKSTELVKQETECTDKVESSDFVIEKSLIMVVDPSVEYDSSFDSDNHDQTEIDPTQDIEIMQDNYLRNVFMCQYCDKAFITQESCTDHELNCHDPKLPYSCIECSLVFAERTQHVQHMRQVHGNDKPYICPECEKSFGRRSDLRKHSIVHTGVRPYQCHYCFKCFSRNTNLSKHLRIHAGQKPHVCPLCPRSFVAKGDLQRHVLVHSGNKPFPCRSCPLTFSRRDKLIKHEMRHGIKPDGDQGTDDMVVNVNPFSNMISSPNEVDGNTDFELPRVPEHITGESSFITQQFVKTCVTSKPVQSSPPKLKAAPNKNKPKNIKCHQCPKRFSSLDAYKNHVSLAHIGSRVFQCKICFKKFIRKKELDKHVAIHNGMLPFSCNQCDKKFTRKDKLVEHEATHDSVVVNMPCIECGVTFEKKADLVAHIKSHFSDELAEKAQPNDLVDSKDFQLGDNVYNLGT